MVSFAEAGVCVCVCTFAGLVRSAQPNPIYSSQPTSSDSVYRNEPAHYKMKEKTKQKEKEEREKWEDFLGGGREKE